MKRRIPYFIYGTLLRGHSNYKRYQLDKKSRYLGKVKLKGYQIYNLGGYPAIVESQSQNDVVFGELMDIEPATASSICNMEIGAGYFKSLVEVTHVKTGRTQWAFVFVQEKVSEYAKRIPSGDYKDITMPVTVKRHKRGRTVVTAHRRQRPRRIFRW